MKKLETITENKAKPMLADSCVRFEGVDGYGFKKTLELQAYVNHIELQLTDKVDEEDETTKFFIISTDEIDVLKSFLTQF